MSDWTIEGPANINRHSVISTNHYIGAQKPAEFLPELMGGRNPKMLMDIHDVSDVNDPKVDLSLLPGPAIGATFTKKQEQ